MNQAESDRLAMLRLPLIAGVIFIHAFSLQAPYPADLNAVVQLMLSEGIARLAVPIFFLMAGFFLYGSGPGLGWSWPIYRAKLKARARTLLVPMLLWGLITLGIFSLAQALPQTRAYFSGATVVANFSAADWLNALLGVSGSPLAYQFWFIRDLIIAVVASPVLVLLLNTGPRFTLALLTLLWLFTPKPYPIPAPEAVLFFTLGLFCRARGLSLFSLDRAARWLWAPYLLLVALTPLYLGSPYGLAVQKVGIAPGVPLALWLTGLASPGGGLGRVLLRYAPASFFVFAAHEPLLTVVKKLLPKAVPSALGVYLLAPVIVLAVLLVLHALLARALPRVAGVLSGGR